MKDLRNLARINNYLANFEIFSLGCGWHYVTAQADATSTLDKSAGNQVLIARPDFRQTSQESDGHRDYIDTAIFVLAKGLGQARTDDKENILFVELLGIANVIVGKIREDIAGDGCPDLAGFVITDIRISPEASIFGGWCGYSIDISFEI